MDGLCFKACPFASIQYDQEIYELFWGLHFHNFLLVVRLNFHHWIKKFIYLNLEEYLGTFLVAQLG